MATTIQALVIPADAAEPVKRQRIKRYDPGAMIAIVGGYIEPLTLGYPHAVMYMNDGKSGRKLPDNPRATALVWVHNLAFLGKPIEGDTFIVGPPKGGNVTDVPDDLVQLLMRTAEYVAQVRIAGQSSWSDNGQVYDNWLAAYAAVGTLARKWPSVEAARVVPCEGPEVKALKAEWYDVGLRNRRIKEASDPPFTMRSLSPCYTVQELGERLTAHLYAIGASLYYRDLS